MATGKHGFPIAEELQNMLHESLAASAPVTKGGWGALLKPKTDMPSDYNSEEYINAQLKKMKDPVPATANVDLIEVTSLGDTHKSWFNPTDDLISYGQAAILLDMEAEAAKMASLDNESTVKQQHHAHAILETKGPLSYGGGDASSYVPLTATEVSKKMVDELTLGHQHTPPKKVNGHFIGVDYAKEAAKWAVVNDPDGKYMKMEKVEPKPHPDPMYYQMGFLKEEWVNDLELQEKYTVGSLHEFEGSPKTWRLTDIHYDLTHQRYKLTFIETPTKKPWKDNHHKIKFPKTMPKTGMWQKKKDYKPIWGTDWLKKEPTPEVLPEAKMEIKTERDKVFASIGQ